MGDELEKRILDAEPMQSYSFEDKMPKILGRHYTFPEQKKILPSYLKTASKYPVFWGLAGAAVWAGLNIFDYFNNTSLKDFILNPQINTELKPEKIVFDFIEFLFLSGVPLIGAYQVNRSAEKIESIIEKTKGNPTNPPKMLHSIDKYFSLIAFDMKAQGLFLLGEKEKSLERFKQRAESDSYDLGSRISIVHMEMEKLESGDTASISEIFRYGKEMIDISKQFGPKTRKFCTMMRLGKTLLNIKDHYLVKLVQDSKNVTSYFPVILANLGAGFDKQVLENIDDLLSLETTRAVVSPEGKEIPVSYSRSDLYAFLSYVLGAISETNRQYCEAAKKRYRWCSIQTFLEAKNDPKNHVPVILDSKNRVYFNPSKSFKELHIIKEYPTFRDSEGELFLTEKDRGILSARKEFMVPEIYDTFRFENEGQASFINLLKAFPGKTLNQLFYKAQGKINWQIQNALEMMAMIYAGHGQEDYGLNERNEAAYLLDWAEKAGIKSEFEIFDLGKIYTPLLAINRVSPYVVCHDPHPMNLLIGENGEIIKIDNELTRMIAVQGELVKFFELLYEQKLYGIPDNKDFFRLVNDFSEHFNQYSKSSEKKIELNDAFFIGYLNHSINLGVSLYSPYSLRNIKERKRALLLKSEKAIEVIKYDFSSFYGRHQDSYRGLNDLINTMNRINGFV